VTRLVLTIALVGSTGPEARSASRAARVSCTTPYGAEIDAALEDVSSVWTVPRALIKAVIQRESAFDPTALSRAGAIGLMQVLPRNAPRLGVALEDLWVPRANILAGTRLLAILLRHYRGDVVSALVAYDGRPRRLFAPVPENGETQEYVRAVVEGWRRFERCGRRIPADPRPDRPSGARGTAPRPSRRRRCGHPVPPGSRRIVPGTEPASVLAISSRPASSTGNSPGGETTWR
jgi:hypothetical protein